MRFKAPSPAMKLVTVLVLALALGQIAVTSIAFAAGACAAGCDDEEREGRSACAASACCRWPSAVEPAGAGAAVLASRPWEAPAGGPPLPRLSSDDIFHVPKPLLA